MLNRIHEWWIASLVLLDLWICGAGLEEELRRPMQIAGNRHL